jgi:predicted CXXCH cytochrome family protein
MEFKVAYNVGDTMALHTHITGGLLRLASVSALLFGLIGLSQPVLAGIATTKHNLSTGSTATNRVTAGTDEICVFCHTPHAADTTAPVPLWNKRLSTGATYTTYASLNSSTIDGEILPTGSISLACLSCHDGTQAMDNIINAPGSGGYDATGGGPNGLGYTWTGNVTAAGMMTNLPTTLAMLGTDLSNDHPIGIRYCGGGQSTATPSGACVDADFVAPSNAVINSNQVWWVDTTGGTASREKTDMILYTRAFTGATGPSVECASCHDPHTSVNPTFLRISNAGSGVCLACHVK